MRHFVRSTRKKVAPHLRSRLLFGPDGLGAFRRRRAALGFCALVICFLFAWGLPVHAAEGSPRGPMEGERALPGFVRVGLARGQDQVLALRVASGYGFIEAFGGVGTSTQRLSGDLAIAYSPLPRLSLALDFSGRLDVFPGSQDGANMYGEPRLTARGVVWENGRYALALQADARFIGGAAPDIDFSATSPTFVALLSSEIARETEVGLELGVHFDRSSVAVEDPSLLSAADRITLGASSSPAVRIGAAGRHSFPGLRTVWLAELWADLLVLDGAPPILESPITLSVGARHSLSRLLALQTHLDFGLSARPSDFSSGQLQPIGSRVGLVVALIMTPGRKEPKAAPAPVAAPPPPPPRAAVPAPKVEVASVEVRGRVVDESGQGVPDVEIVGRTDQGPLSPVRTEADGGFLLTDLAADAILSLEVRATGFDVEKRTLDLTTERSLEITVYQSLPRGVVRGTVRDVLGSGLAAQIRIEPGSQVIDVAPDGVFQVELPPGAYRLAFESPGFRREERSVTVAENGVVILNIGLIH